MLHQAVDVNDVDRVRKLVSKASTEGRRRSSSISIASPPKALLSPSLMLNSIDPETGRTVRYLYSLYYIKEFIALAYCDNAQ